MAVKLIHTSDIHLGARFSFLGARAGEQRALLRSAFSAIVDQSISAKANLLVIAGDLFDTPYPAQVDVSHVLQQLTRAVDADICVAVTPGNHDRLETGSVFANDTFKQLESAGRLKIFRGTAEVWEIPELQTAVYGTGTRERITKKSPLEGLKVETSLPYKIGVFHGSLDITNGEGNAPVSKQQIEDSGLTYVAFGDWHSALDASVGGVTAWYSGSPEMLQPSQKGAGRILQVEVDNDKAQVRQLQSGKRKVVVYKLLLDSGQTDDQVLSEIKSQAGSDDFIVLEVEGALKPGNNFDLEALTKLLDEQFFYVKLNDKSRLQIDEQTLKNYPESTIIGRFIRGLQAKKNDDPEHNALIDEAIQAGVALLQKNAN